MGIEHYITPYTVCFGIAFALLVDRLIHGEFIWDRILRK